MTAVAGTHPMAVAVPHLMAGSVCMQTPGQACFKAAQPPYQGLQHSQPPASSNTCSTCRVVGTCELKVLLPGSWAWFFFYAAVCCCLCAAASPWGMCITAARQAYLG